MAFVNLPPNLQDIFRSITDRIAKLETGPSQAMYTADTAQATAITANSNATTALANAATANATATAAAYTAGVAQTSANGKNTSNYYVAAPSAFSNNRNGTTPIAGDLWFVTDSGTGYVTGQYIYNVSSGWTVSPITNTVIANLDAGKINAGTITGIAYNNGSGTFSVSPSGTLVASNANITGTVNANAGNIGGWVVNSGYLNYGSTSLWASAAGSLALSTGLGIQAGGNINGGSFSSAGDINISGKITAGTNNSFQSANFTSTISITGGYGVTTNWSPNTDNSVTSGQSGHRWSQLWAATTTINTSDSRTKTDIVSSPLGLNFINKLNPVSFKYIVGQNEIVKDENGEPIVTGQDENGKDIYQINPIPGKRDHFGLIAQEVKEVLDEVIPNQDFGGWVLTDKNDPNSEQGLRYEEFVSPLIKAVQELTARVQELETKLSNP